MGTAAPHLEQLRERGVALLRGSFASSALGELKDAAETCFRTIDSCEAMSRLESYRFSSFTNSVVVPALRDFGYTSDLTAPSAGAADLIRKAWGGDMLCNFDESWVRRRFAPTLAPPRYQPNTWHQDGGLGVRFGSDPGRVPPMTPLITCWIPLNACGGDSPGLEFVSRRLDGLLHYTELDDAALRRRFSEEEFQAPLLEYGDGLIFLNGTLHRTSVRPEMRSNRLSVEYRFFPADWSGH